MYLDIVWTMIGLVPRPFQVFFHGREIKSGNEATPFPVGGASVAVTTEITTEMGALISRFFGTYYLKRARQDSTVLHYRRTPTWRSLVLFIGS